jgi:uncharacterized protein (AIM24 family)
MAAFTIREVEGMRQVRIDLADEAVRVEAGAMASMRGAVRLTASLPGPMSLIRSALTDEAAVRPRYEGTGSVMLRPSLGGYHVLDLAGETWDFEPGAYLASEDSVTLGLKRERFWPGFWAGDGLVKFLTRVSGRGKVVINTPGPVDRVPVEGGAFRAEGKLVLGRTAGLRFESQLPTRWPFHLLARQKRIRAFLGAGEALVCWTPYWNQHIYESIVGGDAEASLFV